MKHKFFLGLIAVMAAALLVSCKGKSELDTAMELYGSSDYEGALPHFEAAVSEEGAKPFAALYYCFDLHILSRYGECRDEAQKIVSAESFEEMSSKEKRDAFFLLASSSYRLGDYRAAIDNYREMKLLTSDPAVRDNIDQCVLRSFTELFANEAENGSTELASVYDEFASYTKECDKALCGAVYEFMAGMSIYMYDSLPEGRNREDSYLDRAEEYVGLAKRYEDSLEKNLLRYDVIIAERRGKTEVAYKLLDVFLTHFPDDESASLERSFLEDRMKAGEGD
ncbi:MAG: hypothetical protein ILP10_01710 [Lachnospiraceae bacterium]|nr:hypothetical protein [Lachnospiraceae bacterium]